MKIKSIAPWFGGKRGMAQEIVCELGKHRAYFDPFCGSLPILLQKPISSHETVNDLHGDLINLALVIQSDRATELYDRLMRALCVELLFDEAVSQISSPFEPELSVNPTDVHIERAYWYFIVSWIGRNGVAGTKRINYQMAVRWTPGGGHAGIRFRSAVESIPWWHERLRPALILNRDGFDILDRIADVEGVVVYLDPPYMRGSRGACAYEHDFGDGGGDGMFSTLDDHARLAESCKRFKHVRIVVSYYDCDRVRDLYDGWTFRDMTRQKNLHVQNRRGAGQQDAPELLIINGPSYAHSQSSTVVAEAGA